MLMLALLAASCCAADGAGGAAAGWAALRGAAAPRPHPPINAAAPMEAILKSACVKHKRLFDALARARMQLVLDIFFGGMGTPLLPLFGSLMGLQRHGLLCPPWDDDLDFNVGTAEFDALLVREKPLNLSAFSSVEDISASELGTALATDIRADRRCDNNLCTKVITLRVTDPVVRGSTATDLDPLIHSYFAAQPQERQVFCLSLVFVKFGFAKIYAWENQCATGASLEPMKVTDLFPANYVMPLTCPTQDFQNGVANPRCVAHALYQQPNITATARMLTVEGDVELLSPVDEFAREFLAGVYGENWDTQAVICGHSRYSVYDKCVMNESARDLVDVRAVMSGIPECLGLEDGDVGSAGRRQEARELQASAGSVSVLRRKTYLSVARKELNSRDRWSEIFYYAVDDKRKGGRTLRSLSTLGLVSRANDVHDETRAGQGKYSNLFFGRASRFDVRKKQRQEKAVDSISMDIVAA